MSRGGGAGLPAYHEPFIGGGALFFATRPPQAYISDINFHLIITYRAVRDNVQQVISELKKHQSNNSKDYFKHAQAVG